MSRKQYKQVAAQAEPVTIEQLAEIIAVDDNPTIWPGARRPSRIAMYIKVHDFGNHAFVGFDYCDRQGYTQSGTVWERRYDPAVLEFEKAGRLVKLVRS